MEKRRIKPGTRLREWRKETDKNKLIETGQLTAIMQLEKLVTRANRQESLDHIVNAKTELLPAMPPDVKAAYAKTQLPISPPARSLPRFYEHSADRTTSSIDLIYSTIILCHKYHKMLPDAIFVSSQTQKDLIEQAPTYTGAAWTGEFYFSRSRKEIEAIPVYPESFMPDFLRQALDDGKIPAHYAIAVCEN